MAVQCGLLGSKYVGILSLGNRTQNQFVLERGEKKEHVSETQNLQTQHALKGLREVERGRERMRRIWRA
jgi:hypothetical protein